MDPDMVRQQEEAEIEQGRRPAVTATLDSLRERHPMGRVVPLRHQIQELAAALSVPQPVTAPDPETRHRPASSSALMPWQATARALFGGAALTVIGFAAGLGLGVKLGLLVPEQLAIGAGAAFAFGWQSAALALRRSGHPAVRSQWASCLPMLLVTAITAGSATLVFFRSAVPAIEALPGSYLQSWTGPALNAAALLFLAALIMRLSFRNSSS